MNTGIQESNTDFAATINSILAGTSIYAAPKTDIKTRHIQRCWPRDPNGQNLAPQSSPPGKYTSNEIDLWGETLLDFYWTHRIPTTHLLQTVVSGSKMAAWMREIGELDWAQDEIDWADQVEGDPFEVLPCDIGRLIEDDEMMISIGFGVKSMERDRTQIAMEAPENESNRHSTSLFDSCNYPPPWPLVPFSRHTHRLQKRLPLHLLPQKLIVHDPWNLLAVKGKKHEESVEWSSVPDRVHTYILQLSDSLKNDSQKRETARAQAEAEKLSSASEDYQIVWPNIDVRASSLPSPPIMVMLPSRPPPPKSTPEAHLYLSPDHCVGTGNHSFVYNAEWELPRSLLVKDILCQACISEHLRDVLKNGDGKILQGGIPFTGQLPGGEAAPSDSKTNAGSSPKTSGGPSSNPNPSDKPGVGNLTITERLIPARTVQKVHIDEIEGQQGILKGKGKPRPEEPIEELTPATIVYDGFYKGPILRVHTEAKWQNPECGPYCTHAQEQSRCKNAPLTAKVRVAAKLSIQDDSHLAAEAINYESFPSHFFEHWNGFNAVEPLLNPVPVGAVVPQYYGYYVPENAPDTPDSDDVDSDHGSPQYLSPILLLEDCGVPVDPTQLGIDDREECASLYYRLHRAGWNHGSIAPRNILMQRGPLSEYPMLRSIENDTASKSFRLIDFGRSYKWENPITRADEERQVAYLFQVHYIPSDRPYQYASVV